MDGGIRSQSPLIGSRIPTERIFSQASVDGILVAIPSDRVKDSYVASSPIWVAFSCVAIPSDRVKDSYV